MQALDLSPSIDFAGVALGLLMAFVLATGRRGNRAANRWLAAYAGSLALLSLGDFFEDSRLVLHMPHLAHLTDWLIFIVGPCLWMYVRRLTLHDDPRFSRWLLHCVPALLCLLFLATFYVLPAEEKRTLVAAEIGEGRGKPGLALMLAAIQLLIYWWASLTTLRRFVPELRARFSSLEKRTFAWLKWMLAINLIMWLLWMAGLTLQASWATWLDTIAVPLGFYLLAFLGIRQPALFTGRDAFVPRGAQHGARDDPDPDGSATMPASPMPGAVSARYVRSGLDKARVPQLLERLQTLVQTEKPWLENDLTLAQLAERLGVSTHHLSQLLNEELGATFFDFVNALRVKEVQRCLVDPAYREQTILEVALASGFNSKAAFNAAFKAYTGTTPSRFRREQSPRPG
ncbi:MAG: helix-turn-helix transcriptional regulator [Steroidobacteraceae bacterium]